MHEALVGLDEALRLAPVLAERWEASAGAHTLFHQRTFDWLDGVLR